MLDPAAFLLNEHDVPDGFSRIVDGDRSDRVDGAEIKFRTFVRGDGIINCGAYAAPSAEIAATLYAQIRENFASVGGAWDAIPDLGDEALSTNVFPVSGAIQRVAVFRTSAVAGVVHYTDNEALFQTDDVIGLARRMDENGRRAGLGELIVPTGGADVLNQIETCILLYSRGAGTRRCRARLLE